MPFVPESSLDGVVSVEGAETEPVVMEGIDLTSSKSLDDISLPGVSKLPWSPCDIVRFDSPTSGVESPIFLASCAFNSTATKLARTFDIGLAGSPGVELPFAGRPRSGVAASGCFAFSNMARSDLTPVELAFSVDMAAVAKVDLDQQIPFSNSAFWS
jgi:hypothetical protein